MTSSSDDFIEDTAFMSPVIRPAFIEPPLSTKRERMNMYSRIPPGSVSRAARTAPARSRVMARRFDYQKPRQISFLDPENKILHSRVYNPDSPESYFDQVFDIGAKLGEGSFGEVYSVKSKDDGREYAVKKVLEPYRSEHDRALKLREVQKHELLPPHPNLVQFVKAWEERGRLYIQTELCENNLSSYSESNVIEEPEVWNFFIDLLQAVNHLHKHDLIHVDIKPANILLTRDKVCKLGDFGRIFDLKNDRPDLAEEGDCKYLAAEVLNSTPTKAADIFSLGITILELATDLDLPQRGIRWHQIRRKAIPENIVKDLSPDLRRIIFWMIELKPDDRPTAQQLLQDPAIASRIASRKRSVCLTRWINTTSRMIWSAWLVVLTLWVMLKKGCANIVHTFNATQRDVYCANGTDFQRTPQSARSKFNANCSYSDDENLISPRSRRQNQIPYLHFSDSDDDDHLRNVSPCPRMRLNFDEDDGTPTSCSDPSDGPSSPQPSVQRSPKLKSEMAQNSVFGSGRVDSSRWPMNDSSDDDSLLFNGGSANLRRNLLNNANTCPPRIPLRSQLRSGLRKVRPLNLNLLNDDEPRSPANTPQPLPRTLRSSNRRLISDRGSSAEEL